ncbi:MAG: hypothetical protein NVS4B7_21470 [Ktedonobacteraceae bacterium]
MWLVARYLPVSLFSLKSASATASGGKTLLVPTPFALKMALVDAAIRTRGIAEGERLFPLLRDLSIWLEAPRDLVVIKGFGKIQRLLKDKSNAEKAGLAQEQGRWPMQPTIAYREYVYYRDSFQLAVAMPDGAAVPSEVFQLMLSINYLGKRGSFIQIMEQPHVVEQLPGRHFINLTPTTMEPFHMNGTLQMLDDCSSSLSFAHANIYDAKRITVGKERIIRHVVLPYQVLRSSRSYSWYRHIQSGSETNVAAQFIAPAGTE